MPQLNICRTLYNMKNQGMPLIQYLMSLILAFMSYLNWQSTTGIIVRSTYHFKCRISFFMLVQINLSCSLVIYFVMMKKIMPTEPLF
ncbi:Os11g0605300 [Oryza sativa Japonica Group]|uniref:Os11g0605300 protein n=1 Tax=Oryza sativa subsp. japonica TaxID=39947 RepID=Q0IRQ9_ORYSJ|nr:Os11g0605300 [Oryza sativa Japonica Group]|eukprot:NP_001068243.1 Os11g0605300 [Oryza sativa Japonica Group]